MICFVYFILNVLNNENLNDEYTDDVCMQMMMMNACTVFLDLLQFLQFLF